MFGFMFNCLDFGQQVFNSIIESSAQNFGIFSDTEQSNTTQDNDAPSSVEDAPSSVEDAPSSVEDAPSSVEDVSLTEKQKCILESIVRRSKAPQNLVIRAKILLALSTGKTVNQVADELGIQRKTVRKWRNRWVSGIKEAEEKACEKNPLSILIEHNLLDAPRRGTTPTFSPEQVVLVIALACEHPKQSGRPISHWTSKELADEAIKRGIVEQISSSTVRRLLKEAKIKPHLSRYWLNANPEDKEQFENDIRKVCQLYRKALEFHKQGIHVVCTDEKTGIQAIERVYPTKGVKPGLVEKVEFEYNRHGTLCLIANFEVATGKIVAPTIGPRRTEEDFLNHIKQTVETAPKEKWVFVVDNLNTHQSASLVEWVAQQCDITFELGVKGEEGILKSMKTRTDFLSDPTHSIHFIYTPIHTSWLNQVEIWFSILVRRLLKRSNFSSLIKLKESILEFINYFNKMMAKPFKWTYEGKPLVV